jgi:hypothetical protein
MDRGPFFRRRACRGPDCRTDGLRAQHRPVTRRGGSVRDVLDGLMGPNWAGPRDAINGLSGRARASRRASCFPGCDVRRPAGAFPRGNILPANAGWRSDGSNRKSRRISQGALSSYYDEVAIKGLQLAQADLDRDALDQSRLIKIRDTVLEFANDLSDQNDQEPTGERSTTDAEAAAAVEAAAADPVYADLPILRREELPLEWKGDSPVLCIAGRTVLDEAAAIMFAQLCNAHGLRTRVEGPEALSTSNIFRLETEGVALVCLSYLNAANPAQIRYAVRRLRRKLPRARIMVGLWTGMDDAERAASMLESSKADMLASTLREATRLSIEAARPDPAGTRVGVDAKATVSALK